jgi:hypothetical protein
MTLSKRNFENAELLGNVTRQHSWRLDRVARVAANHPAMPCVSA